MQKTGKKCIAVTAAIAALSLAACGQGEKAQAPSENRAVQTEAPSEEFLSTVDSPGIELKGTRGDAPAGKSTTFQQEERKEQRNANEDNKSSSVSLDTAYDQENFNLVLEDIVDLTEVDGNDKTDNP